MVSSRPSRDRAPAWALLGEAYWKRYRLYGREASSREEAIGAIERALGLDPDLPECHNAQGYGFIVEGDLQAAKEELESAVEASPEFDRAWANLGFAYQLLGDYAAGLQAFRTAARLRPDNFRHQVSLGYFFSHFNEYDAAARAYRKAIELKPDSVMAWTDLGTALLYTSRFDDAAKAFERSIAIEETSQGRTNLGTAHFYMENYEKAAANYWRATELEPRKALNWNNLGEARNLLGQEEGAKAAYLEAVKLARETVASAPHDAVERSRLGLYCARAGEVECALHEGTEASKLQPDNAEIAFRAGTIFFLAGRREEALDWLEKAVRLGLSRAQIEKEADLAPLREHPRFQRILELAS